MGDTASGQGRADELSDRTLGDFVVRELIGQGGFGAVYRAEQPLLEREAVIKVIARPEKASDASIARFLREARLASQLDHPYAAHIYAFGAEGDGLQWIAMELVRGSTLAELIAAQGPLPLPRFIPLFDRICEVVHTAHEQGIVHRDIKPENVMVLSRAGRYLPKLLDLGIAKATGDGGAPAQILAGGGGKGVAVTGAHGMLGSPRYMAPELWFAPQTAGPSVDQYALGALAFETLTGAPAFPGETLEAVAMGHAKKPPPRLPEEFPDALAEALVRAMGKRPGDRHESVLALATAVHEGSGIEIKPIEVPELDEMLVTEVQTGYPLPIVDAVGAYLAAHNAHQARDAIRGIVASTTRYIGLLALQCRSRLGSSGRGESERAPALLVELRRGGLSDGEWVELATEVCRPFARRPDSFPIPELVLALFPTRDSRAAHNPLVDLEDASGVMGGTALDDDKVLSAVTRAVPTIESLLRTVSFVAQYPLVIARRDRVEVFMGSRTRTPVTRPRPGENIEPGRVLIEDQGGAPVLSMWPLVQAREPTPGQREELFLLEGATRRGARLIARPIGFEATDADLWDWFSAELLEFGFESNESASERAPYLGMATFSAEDADNFYGREREIEAVANRLRTHPFIAVVGPSGAGKSSFLHAGVRPALGYRSLSVRPGADPIAALEAKLERAGFAANGLRKRLAESPGALGDVLRAGIEHDEALLLVIDQFEEAFTMCRDDESRDLYIAGLCAAVRDAGDPLRIALTLRDDFLMVAEKNPQLRPKLARGLQLLGTPAPADLRRILIEPARRAGYQFEDDAVVDEMVDDVAELAGALPLLSFTAAKLWSLRDRHFKQLPTKAYRSLGGVVGALAQHAEDTLDEMTAAERKRVREAFRHLVTAEGTRDSLTREELTDVLGGGDDAQPVIEKLVSARILVASESDGGAVMIEVIHEALLSAWPRLARWRREDAEGARLRDQLRAAARQWDERGRPAGLLWRGDALTELTIWRGRFAGELPATDAAFAEASGREARRGRRIRQTLIFIAFVALAIGVVVLFRASRAAQKSAAEARASANDAQSRLIALMGEQGRQAHLDGRPLDAILYLNRAYQLGAEGRGLEYMISRAVSARDRELATIPSDESSQFWGLAFNPSGTLLAAADGEGVVLLIDPPSGAVTGRLQAESTVNRLAFSKDGKRLLVVELHRAVSVWDVDARKRILELAELKPPISHADMSAGGEHLLVLDSSGTSVWNLGGGHELWRSDAPVAGGGGFSPDGTRVAVIRVDGDLELRELSGAIIGSNPGHTAVSFHLAWSRDGKRIATASYDGTVRIWDGTTAAPIRVIKQRGKTVAVSFSPDGKLIVTGGQFETGGLYDVETGEERFALRGHTGFVNLGRFVGDGSEVLTASQDGTIRLWSTERGTLLSTYAGHTGFVWDVAVDPSAPRFASASWDTTVRLWNRSSRQLVAFVPSAGPSDYAVTTDRVIAATETGARLASGKQGNEIANLDFLDSPVAAVSTAGERAFVASQKSLFAIDARTGTALGMVALETPVTAIASHRESVVVLDRANQVSLYSGDSLEKVGEYAFGDRTRRVIAISPNGEVLAVGGQGTTLLALPALSVLSVLAEDAEEELGEVTSVDFDSESRRIAVGRFGTTARVWSVDGEQLAEMPTPAPVFMIRFGPAGERVITTAMDAEVAVWRASDGSSLGRLAGHAGAVFGVAFSPNGELILTTSSDRTARLWDGATLELLDTFAAHNDDVEEAWFSGNSDRAILASRSGIAVFDLGSAAPDKVSLEQFVVCRIDKELGADGIRPRTSRPNCAAK